MIAGWHKIDGLSPTTACYNIDGELHNDDGPAIIHSDGAISYYVNGICHRIDGPAIIRIDASVEWYINGYRISEKVNDWLLENNISYPFDEETKMLFKLRFL